METTTSASYPLQDRSSTARRKQKDVLAVSPQTNFILNGLFIIYGCLCLLPILLVISVSFSDEKSIALHGYKLIPLKFSLSAYKYLWFDIHSILTAYGISILTTVAGTAAGLIMTALFAYPLSRKDFHFRGIFSFFIFFTMIFSGGLVPWYLMYANVLQMKDTLLALIVPGLLMNAFYVIIMRTFFQTTIHPSIIESATMEGASEGRILVQIIAPLSLPVFATIGLFYSLGYWNGWYNSLIFINNDEIINLQYMMYKVLMNLQFLLANAQAGSGPSSTEIANLPNESVRMAMCIVGTGPMVFAYPFFQKYFVKGLTVGAVKG
ncbi:carbohydrate ABC transporter membrane protein 2 (CUT1 family) [Paenibacillus taihuensis]|uniref:Carbohydrate ABC transporter membrane protein 2 (CUT1 family) n=1 Tax=Paenibacillus taihuensis TaxID=1156355 RepID=A0A3D9S423_9BACL|nr:carbohydrate ABC transporter permease [Paenibacillus taihuensis]REE87412.1 carbohydrate ABC transporter membrane protein 2 (CUT1 family) [Paenibacillus taihuensis]